MKKEASQDNLERDEEDDFGFTAVNYDDIKPQTVDYEEKMMKLYNMIMPLLNNLMKDPEKDIIHWPDRTTKIRKFIDKMNKVIK